MKRRQLYCSRACTQRARHAREARRATITCEVCGKVKSLSASMALVQRYCSRACWAIGKSKYSDTFTCVQCGKATSRSKSSRVRRYCSKACQGEAQRSGGYVSSQGYRVVGQGGRPVLEHRIVMERILGRPLSRGESVHHRDGNRLNNDPANLELWNRGQPAGQRVAEKIAWASEYLRLHGYAVVAP